MHVAFGMSHNAYSTSILRASDSRMHMCGVGVNLGLVRRLPRDCIHAPCDM